MEIKDGLEALLAEDMIPRDRYRLVIRRINEATPERLDTESDLDYAARCASFNSPYSVAKCEILAARDPGNSEMVGRRVDFWMISEKSGRRGLATLLHHKAIYDAEGGWEQGVPADENGRKTTQALIGVEFFADVTGYKKQNNEWGYNVYPVTREGEGM